MSLVLNNVVRFDVGMSSITRVEVSTIVSNSCKAPRAPSRRAVPCFPTHRHSTGPEINFLLRWCLQGLSQNPGAGIAMLLAMLAMGGCATLPDGHGWGRDATVIPGWQRVRDAAVHAAESPRIWGPLAASAAFQIDGW